MHPEQNNDDGEEDDDGDKSVSTLDFRVHCKGPGTKTAWYGLKSTHT